MTDPELAVSIPSMTVGATTIEEAQARRSVDLRSLMDACLLTLSIVNCTFRDNKFEALEWVRPN